MPQININEIDQSVFTRVVNDDKVKVLVPCIASFGPVYDGVEDSAMTFTDVTAFERAFGYTEPEYNPFPNDVSRTYIKQLINRGAAVSVVRVNSGITATSDLSVYSQIKGEGIVNTVSIASIFSDDTLTSDPFIKLDTQPMDWYSAYYTDYFQKDSVTGKYSLIPQTFTEYTGSTSPEGFPTGYYTIDTDGVSYVPATASYSAETTYYQAQPFATNTYYKVNNASKYKFCKQITGLKAKYTGSFGNHLLVTFTPVTSVNANFKYQYSIVTVYRADILVNTKTVLDYTTATLLTEKPDNWDKEYYKYYTRNDSEPYVYTQIMEPIAFTANTFYTIPGTKAYTSKTVTGVHKLEDHIVTTNPNDVNYIEDVDFNFIEFELIPSARDEFAVAWSNIGNTGSISTSTIDNGFPTISLKYTVNNISVYNEDALFDRGYDFMFNSSLLSVLDTGYQTINVGNAKLTVANINDYILECYGNQDIANGVPGIYNTILKNVQDCYINYSDPYIYDFDFITSGGFVNDVVLIKNKDGDVLETKSQVTALTYVAITHSTRFDAAIPSTVTPIHAGMLELVKTRKDCIALADVNPGWNPSDLPQYVEYLNESQCTVHSPWCYTADPYNSNALTLMPPSFVFLYTLLSNLINSPDSQKWFPPAGVTRATARVVVKPYYEIGSTLLNAWQNDTLARVNPIMRLKNYGYVIYGQYTSYVAIDQFTHSALESLNVRLVANCVKKQIFNLCLKLAFEPNNSSLWFKFYDGMDKYLLFMKRNDGVYDYRIQMDESTVTTDDINELRCPGKVWINPTRTAEFFDIDFILTEAGVTFNEEGE